MALSLATSWTEVEVATKYQQTCIAPGQGNYAAAKDDWEQHPGAVEYWVSPDNSYSRVLLLVPSPEHMLWLLDYAKPFNVPHIQELAACMYGRLMVSGLYQQEWSTVRCQRIVLPTLARPDGLKHVARMFYAQEWAIIQGTAPTVVARTRPPTPIIYDDD